MTEFEDDNRSHCKNLEPLEEPLHTSTNETYGDEDKDMVRQPILYI